MIYVRHGSFLTRFIMKRKLSLLFITVLIIGACIPALSIALAKRPDNTPPPREKIVFIHYKKGYAKPPWAGPPDNGGGDEGYYEFLGKGVKWKTTEISYVIDDGLTDFAPAIQDSAEEWDSWTSSELFNDDYDIVSDGTWDGWEDSSYDGRNEFVFGDYPQEGVIAVCVVWGTFRGPPDQREIIEFDVLFDIDFIWGDATSNPDVMDMRNIATHEIGHGVGLADLYDGAASEETMYGYASYGEIKKRDLYIGDIAGIQELYGE